MEFIFSNGVSQLDCIARIVAACLCGALIGFERSRRQKEAGIRTHIIVALGSSLMMIVSKYGFFDMVDIHSGVFTGDRIAANIITGVSFLGAGMIFFRGSSVKGLTTAAGIWSTAGVGLAVGAGLYIIAGTATVLILIIQIIFHKWQISADTQVFGKIVAVLENDEAKIDFIADALKNEGIEIVSSRFEKLGDDKAKITYAVRSDNEVSAKQSARLSRIIPEMMSLEVHSNT